MMRLYLKTINLTFEPSSKVEIDPESDDPYFFINDNIGSNNVFLAQNTNSLKYLLPNWQRSRVNEQYSAITPSKQDIAYELFSYRSQGEIKLVKTVKGGGSAKVLGYKDKDNDIVFTALLPLD
jgi:hypothetical protein